MLAQNMGGGRRTVTDPQTVTIVAHATPAGRAALALVRLSGPDSAAIAARIFARARGAPLVDGRPMLGTLLDRGGAPIDQAVLTLHRAPHTVTGEDVAEITLHGSPVIVRETLAACVLAGARPAAPGEFTLRALRAGKIDLAQAEAVRDLVEAATVEQARIAARQLGGEVSAAIAPLAEGIFELLADVEAGLDFSDGEEALALAGAEVAGRAERLAAQIDALAGASEPARRVREGARVVLLGPTNSGKSSIFNKLIGYGRVIVTPEPGTTRDLIEEQLVLEGLPIVLVDAAGVGEPGGQAEAEGMRRALAAAESAHLVLEVYDLSRPERPVGPPGAHRLRVGTHADLPPAGPPAQGTVAVSPLTGEGMTALRAVIAEQLHAPGARPLESVALATERHLAAALEARDALVAAAGQARAGEGAELLAIDLRRAVHALREILGEVGPEALLERIFARFCIGK
jgi:tRNA modification GTPase